MEEAQSTPGVQARAQAPGRKPNIVEAQRLFGSPGHLLKVIAEDLSAHQRFYDAELTSLLGVERLTSTLVMKNLMTNTGPPV